MMCERVERKPTKLFQLEKTPRGQIRTDADVISEELNESFWEIFEDDLKFESEDPDEIRYFEMIGGYWSHVSYDSWSGEYDVDNDVTDFSKSEVTEESVRDFGFLEGLDPESGAPDVEVECAKVKQGFIDFE